MDEQALNSLSIAYAANHEPDVNGPYWLGYETVSLWNPGTRLAIGPLRSTAAARAAAELNKMLAEDETLLKAVYDQLDKHAGNGQAKVIPAYSVLDGAKGGAGNDQAAGRTLRAVQASRIGMRATRWLWEESSAELFTRPASSWLPLGALCLLAGREGCGKSTWAYRIAAMVTTGTLPGAFHGTPRAVVVVATEDAWEQTIVPRLVAAKADLERVYRVDAQAEDYVTTLTLPSDIPALGELCAGKDVALVLLDPLMGAISGALDTHKDHEVRRALEPLSRLAHDGQLTILGLIHVNKSQGSDLLTRIMASRAFSAVARAVLFAMVEQPEIGAEPEAESFLFGQAKNNLAARVPHSVRYHIEGVRVGHDDDLSVPIFSSHIVVDGIASSRIDELMAAQENRAPNRETVADRAGRWLREYLTGKGEVHSAVAKAAGKAAGYNDRTLQRVLEDAGVRVVPILGTNKTSWVLDPQETAVTVDTLDAVDTSVAVVANQVRAVNDVNQAVACDNRDNTTTPREAVANPRVCLGGCGRTEHLSPVTCMCASCTDREDTT